MQGIGIELCVCWIERIVNVSDSFNGSFLCAHFPYPGKSGKIKFTMLKGTLLPAT